MRVHKIVIETPGAPRIHSLVGGRSFFPAPQLGARCICCDAPGRPIDYDPAGDQQRADKVQVPVCQACDAHISRGHRLETFLGGLTGGVGIMLLFSALILWSSRLALVGVILIAAVALYLAVDHQLSRASARRGHHSDFMIVVGAGRCIVRTTNPRVAGELLARHGGAARAITPS